jgi:hypothetical protein
MTLTNGSTTATATPPLADKYNESFFIETMAKVVAHLQDEFDDKLAIIKVSSKATSRSYRASAKMKSLSLRSNLTRSSLSKSARTIVK